MLMREVKFVFDGESGPAEVIFRVPRISAKASWMLDKHLQMSTLAVCKEVRDAIRTLARESVAVFVDNNEVNWID